MADFIPNGITADHIRRALQLIDDGAPHAFAESTSYDLIYKGKRYAPKAVIGLAAEVFNGVVLAPSSFKGGLGSKCFRILALNGFAVISKGNVDPFPDEINEGLTEGLSRVVEVNKYERDSKARARCIEHYGAICQVCNFNFAVTYGVIGEGFIHVHHLIPLADIGKEYVVRPTIDLRPVCPNCHAMLHRKSPPFSIEELRLLMRSEN